MGGVHRLRPGDRAGLLRPGTGPLTARARTRRRAPRLLGLHHLQVVWPVGSEARATDFFAALLGLRAIPKPPHLAVRGGAWFELPDGRQLHVGVDPDFRPEIKGHPAFRVRGLDALRERLIAGGVDVWEDQPLAGHRRFYASDPVGNRLEFLERVPGAPRTSRRPRTTERGRRQSRPFSS